MTYGEYFRYLLSSPWGKATMSFLRVVAATFVAAWVEAGVPVFDITQNQLQAWTQLGIQAGVVLVVANVFGPWEKRYGIHKGSTTEES